MRSTDRPALDREIALADHLRQAKEQIEIANRLFDEGLNAVSMARETVAECARLASDQSLSEGELASAPVTEHRRLHRSGCPPKIDQDPALQTFILARLDRLTYQEIADEIAAAFPEDRRVSKSTVHAWHKRRRKAPRFTRPRRSRQVDHPG